MALPSDLTTITVTGTYTTITGTPLQGQVNFSLTTPVEDSTGKVIFNAFTQAAPLVNGSISIVLPCTDNADLNPTGFSYLVTEVIPGLGRAYYVQLPHTLGSTVDLSALAPVAAPVTPSAFASANTWTATQTFSGNPGIKVTAGAASGDVLTSDASGNATWQASGAGITPPAGDIGGTASAPTVVSTHLSAALPVAQGGTGQATQQAAMDALAGAVTSGDYLRGSGSHVVMSAIQAADVPTLNQNTTGTAANITGTLDQVPAPAGNVSLNSHKITSLANGSGAQDAAAFGQIPTSASQIGGVTSVAAGDTSIVVGGTSAAPTLETGTLDVIAADHPPAGNWSNNSHKITSLANGSGAQDAAAYGQTPAGGNTATIGQGGTGQTTAAAAYNALSPMTTTGDIEYESGTSTAARLAGPTSSTKQFLTSTGTGSAAQAPAWGTLAAGDLPAGTTSTKGALQLDGTAGDIQPTGTAAAAGSAGKAADASHVHVQNFGGIFGDGSDGSVTFDGTTTILGMAPSSSIYTMTRDIWCTSITINNGVTLNTQGNRIFCQGTVTNSGTIQNNGGAGNANGNAGTGASGIYLSLAGGAGSATNGSGGSGGGGSYGGGNGGAAGTGSAGSAGGAGNVVTTSTGYLRAPQGAIVGYLGAGRMAGGAGGGGGGGDNTNKGGGGGAGGGVIAIFAWAVNNGSGTISATGGAGGTPVSGNCGGGGGGGGGVIAAYTLSAWTAGTLTLTAGTLGSGVGSGTNGSNGSVGHSVNVIIQ